MGISALNKKGGTQNSHRWWKLATAGERQQRAEPVTGFAAVDVSCGLIADIQHLNKASIDRPLTPDKIELPK
jgi:thiamine monophosphate kinase